MIERQITCLERELRCLLRLAASTSPLGTRMVGETNSGLLPKAA